MKIKKCCWVAKQYKKGWKLGLSLGNEKTRWIKNVYFFNEQEISKILAHSIVFIEMGK